MAFDGIITQAISTELAGEITSGRIDKIYQPEKEELVFHIHSKIGNRKVYASVNSASACVRFIEDNPINPISPFPFCMLLRKYLQGGHIVSVKQKDSERIIEFYIESINELGFTTSKKLIFEIMGKHSNIVLVDIDTNRIVDSIKRVSIDVNRARQILPGKTYQYPPSQNKIPYKSATENDLNKYLGSGKSVLSHIGGISPAIADELASQKSPFSFLSKIIQNIKTNEVKGYVYVDDKNIPREFHITPLKLYEDTCTRKDFPTISSAMEWYFDNKESSSRLKQKSQDLIKSLNSSLDKLYLKSQRLNEDLLKAKNSDNIRLYGELLTANMHMLKPGMNEISVINYYTNEEVTIPLSPKLSPNKNAQRYFRKFGKSKTAIKEKSIQLEETKENIKYLESVLSFIQNTKSIQEIQELRTELEETGFVRKRKNSIKTNKKKYKAQPRKFITDDGFNLLVGRNNKENDYITMRIAEKNDYWFHTKDIPGSHLILQTNGRELTEDAIFQAASIAAYFSKGRDSENVPVDYVKARYVKKPSGAKPGMVIFTNNKTVWVNPINPDDKED